MDISIIIAYNKSRGFLWEAVRSAEQQIFSGSFEIIVQQGLKTVGANINDALYKANGKYIKLCAEDDILLPNCLQDLFDFAESGEYDFVCSNAENWNVKTNETEVFKSVLKPTISKMSEQNLVHGGSVLYTSHSLRNVGDFDTKLWTGEEFELMLRMAFYGYKFGYIDKTVYKYRIWEQMKSMQGGFTDSEKYIARKRFIRDEIQMKYINNHKKVTQ